MNITDLLAPDAVLPALKAQSKKQLLQELAARAHGITRLPERRIFETLIERERLGTTGVGAGIAIPHGRIRGLKAPMAAVLQLKTPIGFDAPDDQPVGLLIFLLVPEAATQTHLEILSEIAELLSDAPLREKIKASTDAQALHGLIANWKSALTT